MIFLTKIDVSVLIFLYENFPVLINEIWDS